MQRVASLFLPQLPIERLRRNERPAKPPKPSLPPIIAADDEDPGACSVPRGGGWRPGARWAQDMRVQPIAAKDVHLLPAHQRPTSREMSRRSEHADPLFRNMRPDDGASNISGRTSVATPGGYASRPMVLVSRSGQRELVTAACPLAIELGLHPGIAAAHARALIADLEVEDADPDADHALLNRLAIHAARQWTPTASVCAPDGLWLDLTGTSHLFGGEERFCRRVVAFLARLGLTARIAVAGTPGAAHALARYSGQAVTLLEPGRESQAIADLPLAALRLEDSVLHTAARFGLERIADLYPMPRGPLARRLGLRTVERLDQARGSVAEPITPIVPQEAPRVIRRLLEPIGTPDSITQVISDTVDDLVLMLQKQGLGARLVQLVAIRVDGVDQRLMIGASRATRDAKHLKRMFALKMEQFDPGMGIEAIELIVPQSEPLGAQIAGALLEPTGKVRDLAPLVDQLRSRAGADALYRMSVHESDVPERAIRRVSPLTRPGGWPAWKRPARLLRRPELLSQVVALLPDHPPRRFCWRHKDYRVVAGDGPERIHGEWWRNPNELWAVRDYFRVETDGGERFWLFRRGDGVDAPTGDLSWYIHGVFG